MSCHNERLNNNSQDTFENLSNYSCKPEGEKVEVNEVNDYYLYENDDLFPGEKIKEEEVQIEEDVYHITAMDVAAYILQKMGKISTIKLQKLVYYCQAWSLVWDDAPLFSNKIEAWANGPVIPDLFYLHKGLFYIDFETLPYGNPSKLNSVQKETVDAVLGYYGEKEAQWLVELSHLEDPWMVTREGLPFGVPSRREIKYDDIVLYYGGLK